MLDIKVNSLVLALLSSVVHFPREQKKKTYIFLLIQTLTWTFSTPSNELFTFTRPRIKKNIASGLFFFLFKSSADPLKKRNHPMTPLCSTLAPRVGSIQMCKIFCWLDSTGTDSLQGQRALEGARGSWLDLLYPFNWTRG